MSFPLAVFWNLANQTPETLVRHDFNSHGRDRRDTGLGVGNDPRKSRLQQVSKTKRRLPFGSANVQVVGNCASGMRDKGKPGMRKGGERKTGIAEEEHAP